MSHTTTIKEIEITDVDALKAAVNELKEKGIRCDLLENAIPRGYYSNQEGLGKADYVLHLEDSPYDIGFYKQNGKNAYEVRADLYADKIKKVIGVDGSGPNASMGKLFQLYAVHAATRKAVSQGYQVSRIQKEDGTIQLQINT